MTVAKAICLVAIVFGILIISFPALFPMIGTISSIISAATAVLLAVGSYFFVYLGQGEKIEKMKEQIAGSGLDFFIKQYAEDLVEDRLIQDTLNGILNILRKSQSMGRRLNKHCWAFGGCISKDFLQKRGNCSMPVGMWNY